jgi:ubiquinone/menaquinone biosynthesis C-methylase UbiE
LAAPSPVHVLDIGCGTGSLSLLLIEFGNHASGIDLSPRMLTQARNKAPRANFIVDFQITEASRPQFLDQLFDGFLCRHLLWALPKPGDALEAWGSILKPGGRELLIKGFWFISSSLHIEEVLDSMPTSLKVNKIINLGKLLEYWEQEITHKRYAIMAQTNEQNDDNWMVFPQIDHNVPKRKIQKYEAKPKK